MAGLRIGDFEDNDRVFNPNAPGYGNLAMADMLGYDENKAVWRQLRFIALARPSELITAKESMVVAN